MFNAATYFPTAVAGEGTNNKKFDTTAPATNSTTLCAFATTTTVRYILAKPLVSNSATAVPSANQNFGWNILKSDMNNTIDATSRRVILAGDWVFRCSLTASTADSLSSSYGVKIYVHKRSAAGVNTELFNVTSTMAAITTTLAVTVTKTAVPIVYLELDETIHIEYWVQGRGGGATGLISQTITFTLSSAVDIVVPAPGIRTDFPRSFDIAGDGVATKGILDGVKSFTTTGSGEVTSTKSLIGTKSFDVTGDGVGTSTKAFQGTRTFELSGDGDVSITRQTEGTKSFTLEGAGDITPAKTLIGTKSFSIEGTGEVTSTRNLIGTKSFDVIGDGVPTYTKAFQGTRSFELSGSGVVNSRVELPTQIIPTEGGSTTIIKKIFGVFD